MPNDFSISWRCGTSWPPPAKPPSATSAADLRCTVGRLLSTWPATSAPEDANELATAPTENALSAGEAYGAALRCTGADAPSGGADSPSDSVSVRLPGAELAGDDRAALSGPPCKPVFLRASFIVGLVRFSSVPGPA